MKKRYLSILILVTFVVGVFAGCTGSVKNKPSESDETSTAEQTSTSDTNASNLEMSDVKGMTAPGVLPIVTEPVTLTIGLPQSPNVMDYEDNYTTKRTEEETGINLEFYMLPTGAEAGQKFEMMVSANQKLPDILAFEFSDFARSNYGKNGVLVDISNYFGKYSYWFEKAKVTDKQRQDMFAFGTSPEGKLYAFPTIMSGVSDAVAYKWFINKQWLNNLKLEMPTTTDEFYEVLKAFKEKDPNGNNKADEIPYLSTERAAAEILVNSFTYYDPAYMFNVNDGKLAVPPVSEEYRDALRYVKKLVDEELLSPLAFTLDSAGLKSIINAPKEQDTIVGAFVGHPTVLFDVTNEKMLEYDYLPVMEGPSGVGYSMNRAGYYYRVQITKDCEHPEVAFRLIDYFTEEKRSLTQRYGEPGVHWMYRPDDPKKFDEMFPHPSNSFGFDILHATIPKVESPWSNQNKTIWGVHFGLMLPPGVYGANATISPIVTYWGEAKEKGMTVQSHRSYLVYEGSRGKIGATPKEYVTKLIYTEEENTAVAEISSTITSYINESLALFCTGGMDIEKDWDAYIKSLQKMGLQEYLETAQAAYDRMYK